MRPFSLHLYVPSTRQSDSFTYFRSERVVRIQTLCTTMCTNVPQQGGKGENLMTPERPTVNVRSSKRNNNMVPFNEPFVQVSQLHGVLRLTFAQRSLSTMSSCSASPIATLFNISDGDADSFQFITSMRVIPPVVRNIPEVVCSTITAGPAPVPSCSEVRVESTLFPGALFDSSHSHHSYINTGRYRFHARQIGRAHV